MVVSLTFGDKLKDFTKISLRVCGEETISAPQQNVSLYYDYSPGATTNLGQAWVDSLFIVGNIDHDTQYCMQSLIEEPSELRGLRIFADEALTFEVPQQDYQILYDGGVYAAGGSALGFDLKIKQDTFPGETLTCYLSLKSHGNV